MTARTRAARYARALLDVALAEADPQVIEQQLSAVVDLFRGHADLWKVMTNPAVPVTRKQGIVSEMLPKLELNPVLNAIFEVTAMEKYFKIFSSISAARAHFEQMAVQSRKRPGRSAGQKVHKK